MKNKDVMRKLLTMPQSESEHSEFSFQYFKDPLDIGCGTKGCLAGDLPKLSKEWRWGFLDTPVLRYLGNSTRESLKSFFGIPDHIVEKMFYEGPKTGGKPTREQVQAHGIKVLKEHGIDIFED